jgi:serine/threonine-protein kinase
VKLIRPDVLGQGGKDDDFRQRFQREAQATAKLRSPHTVELYDFGVSDTGAFYYVMEHLEGLNLEGMVRSFGPLPAERAIEFLKQACRSLSEAHQAGLVHRDIKPANLFACHLGTNYDFLKVLDFGMVKKTQEEQDSTQLLPSALRWELRPIWHRKRCPEGKWIAGPIYTPWGASASGS